MSHAARSRGLKSFERLYRHDPDPWQFASSAYERGRYGAMLHALGRTHYDTAFEPGCSIGEFTALIAPRCARVLASDVSQTAVEAARRRCAAFPHVAISRGVLPVDIPCESLDLIIFSEIGYYFSKADLHALGLSLFQHLRSGGEFLAVHWLGHSEDHALHGDEAARTLGEAIRSKAWKSERHEGFRIDLWSRA
jgi:SAM-dependent methyltransferase